MILLPDLEESGNKKWPNLATLQARLVKISKHSKRSKKAEIEKKSKNKNVLSEEEISRHSSSDSPVDEPNSVKKDKGEQSSDTEINESGAMMQKQVQNSNVKTNLGETATSSSSQPGRVWPDLVRFCYHQIPPDLW